MPRIHGWLLCLIAAVGLTNCSTTPTDSLGEFQPKVYVEGYLRAGQPVDSLYIGTTAPLLETYSREDLGLVDALVTIETGTRLVTLASIGGGYYSASDLRVEPGDTYVLRAESEIGTVTAETTVPPVPDLSASGATVSQASPTVDVSWSGTTEAGYLTTRKTLALGASIPIELQFTRFGGFGRFGGTIDTTGFGARRDSLALVEQWRFVRQTSTAVQWESFTHYGTYTLLVYAIDQNYGDFLVSSQQDPRLLDEPRFHIDGGVGIFASISADSVFVQVE